MLAVGIENPHAARARGPDVPLAVHLQPVGQTFALFRRHIGEDAARPRLHHHGAIGERGVGILGDKIYFAAPDGFLVAIDAKSGQQRWETKLDNGGQQAGGLLVADGKVISNRTREQGKRDPGEFPPMGPMFLWVTDEDKRKVLDRIGPSVKAVVAHVEASTGYHAPEVSK